VSMLWAGFPALWALASFYAADALPLLAVFASMFYGMTAAMVPVAAGMVGWRRAISAGRGGGWITASALGVVVGGGLIGLTSVVAFN